MPILSGNKQVEAAGLDFLGTNDRGDALPMNNTAATLVKMAGHLISEAQSNLNKSGAVAKGELESSLSATDIQADGSRMSIDILILDRYKFTDQGVNGVERSHGSPYSFKTKYPNKKMATSLLKWMRVRGRRAMKYKAISKTERKDQSIKRKTTKSDDLKSLAYATAASIKKNGIKKTLFWTKAIKATEKEFKNEIAAGFKLDIINSFK